MRTLYKILPLVALAALLAACGRTSGCCHVNGPSILCPNGTIGTVGGQGGLPTTMPPGCTTTDACAGGLLDVGAACTQDGDCCAGLTCVLAPAPCGPAGDGDGCTTDADCQSCSCLGNPDGKWACFTAVPPLKQVCAGAKAPPKTVCQQPSANFGCPPDGSQLFSCNLDQKYATAPIPGLQQPPGTCGVSLCAQSTTDAVQRVAAIAGTSSMNPLIACAAIGTTLMAAATFKFPDYKLCVGGGGPCPDPCVGATGDVKQDVGGTCAIEADCCGGLLCTGNPAPCGSATDGASCASNAACTSCLCGAAGTCVGSQPPVSGGTCAGTKVMCGEPLDAGADDAGVCLPALAGCQNSVAYTTGSTMMLTDVTPCCPGLSCTADLDEVLSGTCCIQNRDNPNRGSWSCSVDSDCCGHVQIQFLGIPSTNVCHNGECCVPIHDSCQVGVDLECCAGLICQPDSASTDPEYGSCVPGSRDAGVPVVDAGSCQPEKASCSWDEFLESYMGSRPGMITCCPFLRCGGTYTPGGLATGACCTPPTYPCDSSTFCCDGARCGKSPQVCCYGEGQACWETIDCCAEDHTSCAPDSASHTGYTCQVVN